MHLLLLCLTAHALQNRLILLAASLDHAVKAAENALIDKAAGEKLRKYSCVQCTIEHPTYPGYNTLWIRRDKPGVDGESAR